MAYFNLADTAARRPIFIFFSGDKYVPSKEKSVPSPDFLPALLEEIKKIVVEQQGVDTFEDAYGNVQNTTLRLGLRFDESGKFCSSNVSAFEDHLRVIEALNQVEYNGEPPAKLFGEAMLQKYDFQSAEDFSENDVYGFKIDFLPDRP
ncbi:MAG: hypothetical protein LBT46_08120 [Planctomycetaceae bacterium]|nr:hypothetical protein [Planctomycetaceae bacterium]